VEILVVGTAETLAVVDQEKILALALDMELRLPV
jgi:hypothetical protein